MARMILAALLLFGAAAPARPQAQADQHLKQAGVCARCHVISVVEWGISAHTKAGTDCVACHGESRGHVADERNNIKPDRIPRGDAIATLCGRCHQQGCPKTAQKAACQSCHHVHALLNPNAPPPAKDERLDRLQAESKRYSDRMAEGERSVKLQQWEPAAAAFRAALEAAPADRKAIARLRMCERRLHPAMPGFEAAGEPDDATGLAREVRVSGAGIVMVLAPGGEFEMGSERFAGSRPVHTVAVEPFYLGKFEITQLEWSTVMGANPSAHQGKGFPQAGRMPVEQISWEDAQRFVGKLNQLVPGGGFRLPTEAEWEYAARANGAASATDLAATAWFGAPASSFAPKPVGSMAPGKLGLFDMQGNVWEWCSDRFAPYPGARGGEPAADPSLRVLRGGGYADSTEYLDPALRHPSRAGLRLRWNGLRVARSIPPAPAALSKEGAIHPTRPR